MQRRKADNLHQPAILIETYWNVNRTNILLPSMSANILIETYWNVNSNALK